MYEKLAGMTGTAWTEREEFQKIYNLDVVVDPDAPPDGPRRSGGPRVQDRGRPSSTRSSRRSPSCSQSGRPVLVGTASVEKSERLRELLERRGVAHEVLNAKQHEREAWIIAQAGRPGAVTIATNMAGRGVDILLGGNPDGLVEAIRSRTQASTLTEATPRAARRRPGTRPTRSASATRTRRRAGRPAHRWAPSATRRAASTTSCAAAPAARAIRARRASSCRSRTS